MNAHGRAYSRTDCRLADCESDTRVGGLRTPEKVEKTNERDKRRWRRDSETMEGAIDRHRRANPARRCCGIFAALSGYSRLTSYLSERRVSVTLLSGASR